MVRPILFYSSLCQKVTRSFAEYNRSLFQHETNPKVRQSWPEVVGCDFVDHGLPWWGLRNLFLDVALTLGREGEKITLPHLKRRSHFPIP